MGVLLQYKGPTQSASGIKSVSVLSDVFTNFHASAISIECEVDEKIKKLYLITKGFFQVEKKQSEVERILNHVGNQVKMLLLDEHGIEYNLENCTMSLRESTSNKVCTVDFVNKQ